MTSNPKLSELKHIFEDLTLNPDRNIQVIVQKTCEVLDGVCSLYNRLDDSRKSLYAWSGFNLPDNFDKQDTPDGHICYEATIKGRHKLIAIEDLDQTDYPDTDPNVRKYRLKSYLGFPVSVGSVPIGSLCIVDVKTRVFSDVEKNVIFLLAKALSFEEERKNALDTLQESEKKYRLIIENSNDGIFVLQDGMVKFHNPRTKKFMGYSESELRSIPFINHIHPDDREMVMKRHIRRLSGEIFSPSVYAFRIIDKNGSVGWGEVNAVNVEWDGKSSVLCFIRNITKQRNVEQELLDIQRDLEQRVADRTKELLKINRNLESEKSNLGKANTALKVLINTREKDQLDMTEKVMFNVKGLISPYIDKLESTGLTTKQKIYLDIIKDNLNDITSPLGHNLSSGYLMFTPTEIKVANQIKHGKTTKDIASTLNLSVKTVQFHRQNIRKKIGIRNKRVNLRTHLLSFK